MTRAQQAKAAIAALGDTPDVDVARRTLAEFDTRDQAAALISTAGGAAPGGSQPWRHEQVEVLYTDIDPLTGDAPIITLQPGEWLWASWRVVTEAFNDTVIVNNTAATLIPAGASVTDAVDDALSAVDVSTANAVEGLIGPDPASTYSGAYVNSMQPLVSPATVAVEIVLNFTANQALDGDGTAGALTQHLLILSAP